jgi:DNA-binding response OmpR family regulator
VDTGQLRAWHGGVPLVLKHPQFVVLAALARARGDVVSKAALLEELHDVPSLYCEDAIRSHVSRLRAALISGGAHPRCIRTIHGQGYALEAALLERRNETTRRLRRIGNDPKP